MLNKVLFVSLVLVVAILGLLVVRDYGRYRQEQEARQNVVSQETEQLRATVGDLDARLNEYEVENKRLNEQCLLGLASYELLSTSDKQSATAPICNIEDVPEFVPVQ